MYRSTLALLLAAALAGCSPKYDWRDYRSKDAPYSILFPGKPASQTRSITLDTLQLDMTMTAVEIDGVVFAVGSARLPDHASAMAALQAMQSALLKNIGATLRSSKDSSTALQAMLEFEADGSQQGRPARLIGKLVARDQRIYQIIILGQAQNLDTEQIDTYLSSFKLN
ncbi:hypothetical protein GTP27_22325 [Pseudoduganella sp. CY13W]|uniref:Transmembrane protein n=1 Tax=Duganella qianjiadongensis TaxID=2692176 RepID=A0ABW9VR52_9BURK|nr:hypothetical protein [Duganella qianjiadongensis]